MRLDLVGPARSRPAPAISYLAQVGVLAALYFGAAKLGLSLAAVHKNVSLVWPPTGLALAAVVLGGYRLWPGIALGAFLVNASTEVSLATAGGIAVGNTGEALVGAWLLPRVARFRPSFDRLSDALGFVTLAAGLSTMVSASVGVASLCAGGAAPWALYASLWWQWWLGDAMGALVVAPVLLIWGSSPAGIHWSLRRFAEAAVLLALLVTVGQTVFGGWFTTPAIGFPLAFAVFPFLIWAALRFGPHGAATATGLVSVVAISGTARQVGPFLGRTPTESLLVVHIFVSVVAVTALVLAAVTSQRRRVEEALRRLAAIVESSEDAIIGKNLDGTIVSWNAGAERLYGYAAGEMIGRSISILVPPDHPDEIPRILERLERGARIEPYETVRTRKDGTPIEVSLSLSPVRDGAGVIVGAAAIARDITARKRGEAALAEANQELTAWVAALERRTREITLLSELGSLLHSCLTAEEAYSVIGRSVSQLFPDEAGAVFDFDASRTLVEAQTAWGWSPGDAPRPFHPEDCWALRRGQAHHVADTRSGLRCPHLPSPAPGASLCLPLVAQGETLGVLHLHSPAGPGVPSAGLSEATQQLAATVAQQLALALANVRLRETLKSQSIRDPLTGLFNRRYLEETLERELRRAERATHALGLIMCDLDHLKQVNDMFGHDAGDTVLREVGALLRAHLRAGDVACRYGGEEFVLILPEASLDDVRGRAEELREAVKHLHLPQRGRGLRGLGPVTLSLGVAAFPQHGAAADALLRAADAALYGAKAAGRDRVMVADLAVGTYRDLGHSPGTW